MANYVLLYSGGSMGATPEDQAATLKVWTDWFTSLGSAVVDGGNPFSGQAKTLSAGGAVADGSGGKMPTGYSILKADSLDAATTLAKGCPQLQASDGQVMVFETFNAM